MTQNFYLDIKFTSEGNGSVLLYVWDEPISGGSVIFEYCTRTPYTYVIDVCIWRTCTM